MSVVVERLMNLRLFKLSFGKLSISFGDDVSAVITIYVFRAINYKLLVENIEYSRREIY